LKVFEFTSDRKMMSVVVRQLKTGKVFVFAKGADSVIATKL
jgi:magnesium-transporting ATPase (P-type)